MARLWCCAFLLLLVGLPVLAQEDAPHVIKPEEIFADSTQVFERLPLLYINDSTRTLYYFDPEENIWLAYAYPDGLDAIQDTRYHARQRSDGTYILNPSGFWPYSQALADEVWIFNPVERSFSRPEATCGLVRALPGEGEWVITEDEIAGERYLCFTEAGEMSPPIPKPSLDLPCTYQRWNSLAKSPDRRWIIVFCTGIESVVYSYDTHMQQFLNLGQRIGDENHTIEVVRWLNTTEVILHNNPSWSPQHNVYYIARANQPESLEFVADDVDGAPRYYDDPPHLEWIPCEFALCGPAPTERGLRYYDFATQELTVYPPIERIRGVGDVIPDGSGDRLYRSLNYDDKHGIFTAPSATLIRYNYQTLETTEIYTGEIEWTSDFSPDGRYVVLCIGHDNDIASNSLLANSQATYSLDENAELVILDLQLRTIVNEALDDVQVPCMDHPFRRFTFDNEQPALTWLDADTFFAHGRNRALIVTLGENVEIEAEFAAVDSVRLSPDNQRILIWDKLNQINIYDIATNDTSLFIRPEALDHYALLVSWQSSDEILVTVIEYTGDSDYRELARWRVQISD